MRRGLQGPSSVIDCLIKAFEAGLCLRSSEAALGTSILQALPHTVISVSLFPNPPFSSLILFSFPRTCFPPACLLFLSLSLCLLIIPVIQVDWVTAEGPGQSLKTPPAFLCSVRAPLLAPSAGLGPAGSLVHLPHVGTILCARPRLVAHLLGQVRGMEVGNRALMERGSCLSPLF